MEMEDEDVYDDAIGDKSEYDRFAGGPAADDSTSTESKAPGKYPKIHIIKITYVTSF